ncbi:putative Ulp1 peptidase [Rosa chinensis]|uniref:Putative Ulp1 peptidase n=1 Tax=Rosa chinensis TaxID=74649 RepID=A0A2P6PQ40_ROSCH|nr:putative Ulp1 peptidase [Rosa chinensis]
MSARAGGHLGVLENMKGHISNERGIWFDAPADFSKTIVSLPLEKISAIRDMGFGPLQTIGCPNLYEDVCHMMLNNLEPLNQTVVIHGRTFCITASDFERIMGVKDGGVDVDFSGGVNESVIAVLKKELDGNDGNITMNSLKDIVLNRREVDGIFKVAFVMYAMSGLLCPTEGNIVDHMLLVPLMKAESIRGLNWATYCCSKLQDAVLSMKPGDNGRISVCFLFLQLFYFDVVGTSLGLVDKSITPLIWWEVDMASELVEWIGQQGGVSTDNKRVWEVERKDSWCNFKVPQEDQEWKSTNASAYDKMKAVCSDMDCVKEDVDVLKDNVSQIVRVQEGMSMQIEGIQQSLKDLVPTIVKEVVKQYNPETNERRPLHTTWTERGNTELKSNNAQSNSGKKLQSVYVISDDTSSLKFPHSNNANPGVAAYHQAEKEKNLIDQDCAVSDCSVSPGGPPMVARMSRKEKKQKRSTPAPIHIVRALFKTRTRKGSNKVDKCRGKFSKHKKSETIHAGPFSVHKSRPKFEVELLSFIFWPTPPTDPFSSVVVANIGGMNLTRTDLQSLGPRQLVCNMVINIFAMYMNEPGKEDWYLPTFFASNLIKKDVKMSVTEHVERIRSVCALKRFDGRLSACRRIFIPMHEEGTNKRHGHWYLLVVHVRDRHAEILDSYPANGKTMSRIQAARLAMNMLDRVFVRDIAEDLNPHVSLGTLPFDMSSFGPIQRNTTDCGVFVIRNMQHYGTDWAAKYDSDGERASLVLECLLHQRNDVPDLHVKVDHALALWRGTVQGKPGHIGSAVIDVSEDSNPSGTKPNQEKMVTPTVRMK